MTMAGSPRAQRAREQFCKDADVGISEIETYRAHENGDSVVSTLSPTIRSLLDIELGDELTQHVDTENRVIIIEVHEDE
jgi:hypothetical protein